MNPLATTRSRWTALVTLLTVFAAPRPVTAASTRASDSLDVLVRQAMSGGFTPGLAVAVVRGDQLEWSAGYGLADRESGRPVTETTRFYIASTTKAFTALAAAQRASRGELDLDAPLSKALPGAQFHAGLSGDSIRVLDLLTHTHGIDSDGPTSVRVAFTGDYSYADLLRSLAAHPPAGAGRAFDYSNLGYDLAGIVLDPAHKGGWKRVVELEVTRPLGMTATTAYRSKVRDADLAMPYEMGPDGFERIPLAKQDANMGPAGGMFSTAGDLARLIVAELNGGRVGGYACIPAAVIAATQRLRATQDRDFTLFHRFGWGLGWDLGSYDGDTLLHRFGSFPGYRSHVSYMPGRGLGVAVLVNGGGASSMLSDIVATAVYDHLLGRPDAAARMDDRLAKLRAQLENRRKSVVADRAKRAARSQQLPHPLAAYAGAYTNPDWGTLELKVSGERLEAVMGVAESPVEVYDASRDELRVELFGSGGVLRAVFAEGDTRAREIVFEKVRFARR